MLRRLRHRLEYAIVLPAIAVLGRLPLAWVRALGRGLGRAAYHLGVARRTGRRNLEERLGLKGAERDAVLKRAYASFGQTTLELMAMPRVPKDFIAQDFDYQGVSLVDLQKQGKGVLCLSAHYGNWEWMAAALADRGLPVTLLIGTQSNPWVDELFIRHRGTHGLNCVRIGDLRGALKALKAGHLVAILHDQDGDKWGTFAPFFGAQASTHSVAVLLARRSGAPMAFGLPRRLPDGTSRVVVHQIPEAPEGLSELQATAWRLTRHNELLEAGIREDPGQWLWMHNRWRSVPLHRLAGEERARAERGEIVFDTAAQCWRDRAGAELTMETWK